jgi:3',5'-cyclic-AMP phosphodiesterase
MNRRELLRTLGLTGAAASLGITPAMAAPAGSFRFLFFTDTHIQPELHATEGCRMAFAQMVKEPVEFAVCGGDLVFDALAVDRTRAHMLWDLFKQTSSSLHVPVHYTLGNHDVFGITPKSLLNFIAVAVLCWGFLPRLV